MMIYGREIKMQNKPGYKNTELGWIPEDWEVKELKTLGTFLKGKGISRDDIRESDLACIRYGEIYTTYDTYFSSIFSFIDEASAKESQLINQYNLLFTGSGEIAEEIGKCVA
jgi:type I restriction enzyme S subunit